ncbi:MAG: RNA-directed DNA polymerase, partial [Clostridia bacterium]|nr:RNA-directed DNA polymerase [Clostridia bacterium]
KAISDERIRQITKALVDDFGDIGLGLGSQVSQILSLAYANKIDHYMKEVMNAKYYGRYMDDGYIISNDKNYLHRCMNELKRLCDELQIKLNIKKTHISKLNNGFTFLKRRFYLCDGGRLIRKICKAGTTRMRRKLKKFKQKTSQGIMCFEDVCNSLQSWIGHTKHTNCYKSKMSMIRLFRDLYKEYITGGNLCIKY